jgi:hypothetical protein
MSEFLTKNKETGQLNTENTSIPLSSSLEENVSILKEIFESCDDFVFHHAQFDNKSGCLVYLSEMVNNQVLVEIEQGLFSYSSNQTQKDSKGSITTFIHRRFPFSSVGELNDLQTVAKKSCQAKPFLSSMK